ncbi:hypothetical protein GCM10020000_39110 [Streptomyces olivoverticillatus]
MPSVTAFDNKQVILGFIAALNDRASQDWVQYLAPDVVDHNKIIFLARRKRRALR